MTDTMQGAPPYKDVCVRKGKRLRAASELPDDVRQRLDALFSRDALQDALEGVDGDRITGPGGLITELAGRVIEAALGAELTAHVGHPPGGRPAGANVRNGSTPKTLQTDLGPVEIRTPRDRDGSFEPRLVPKGQTRVAGLDDRILDLYAGGLSTRDISEHLEQLYGVDVGRDTISRVTAAVMEDVKAWQARPLERVYPIVYFDAMRVKVRKDGSVASRACYLALGVTCEGDREPLGLWWQDTEGAKFWLGVLNELQHRGVEDILIACVDGLTGYPEAIEAVFPQTWTQTCIVHEIRASMRFVSYKDRKKVAAALRPIYTAPSAEHALAELDAFERDWGAQYPMIGRMWRRDWDHITPFLSLPPALRRVVYTTNSIEAMHRHVRKAIKTRGAFPDEQAATKLIWLAITRAETKWRRAYHWTRALAALKIHFDDRLPD
jgi:putative transposase